MALFANICLFNRVLNINYFHKHVVFAQNIVQSESTDNLYKSLFNFTPENKQYEKDVYHETHLVECDDEFHFKIPQNDLRLNEKNFVEKVPISELQVIDIKAGIKKVRFTFDNVFLFRGDIILDKNQGTDLKEELDFMEDKNYVAYFKIRINETSEQMDLMTLSNPGGNQSYYDIKIIYPILNEEIFSEFLSRNYLFFYKSYFYYTVKCLGGIKYRSFSSRYVSECKGSFNNSGIFNISVSNTSIPLFMYFSPSPLPKFTFFDSMEVYLEKGVLNSSDMNSRSIKPILVSYNKKNQQYRVDAMHIQLTSPISNEDSHLSVDFNSREYNDKQNTVNQHIAFSQLNGNNIVNFKIQRVFKNTEVDIQLIKSINLVEISLLSDANEFVTFAFNKIECDSQTEDEYFHSSITIDESSCSENVENIHKLQQVLNDEEGIVSIRLKDQKGETLIDYKICLDMGEISYFSSNRFLEILKTDS